MPSPSKTAHQEKEEDKEREELIEGCGPLRKEAPITGTSWAAYADPGTEGAGPSPPRTQGKNNLGFALLVKRTDAFRVLMY